MPKCSSSHSSSSTASVCTSKKPPSRTRSRPTYPSPPSTGTSTHTQPGKPPHMFEIQRAAVPHSLCGRGEWRGVQLRGRSHAGKYDGLSGVTKEGTGERSMSSLGENQLLDQDNRLFGPHCIIAKLQHWRMPFLMQLFLLAFIIGPFLFGYVFSRNKQQKVAQADAVQEKK